MPGSEETARSVFLEFELEHPIAEDWAAEGWVDIDGVEFELDLKPGGDGVRGHPSDWYGDVSESSSYVWGEASGELLVGAIPPVAGERTVAGQLWGIPGTEVVRVRAYARE